MRVCKVPLFVVSLLGFGLLSGLEAPTAYADFTFGAPINLGPAINTSDNERGPCLSPDGLELYFSRMVGINFEIWVDRRATADSEWGQHSRLGPPIGPDNAGSPFITSDGLSLYFDGVRLGGARNCVWMATRATIHDDWGTPVDLGAEVNNTVSNNWAPILSADGLELYFTSGRPGGSGADDLWVASRATVQEDWGTPVNLGATINTSAEDTWPGISPDGLVLFFCSNRPGGFGEWDMYMTKRATKTDPWGAPTNLGSMVNGPGWQGGAKVSFDSSMLFFYGLRDGGLGGSDIWQSPIIPIVDFNADGKVDLADMTLLEANLGKSNPLYDIGPFPLGDGVVDMQDLRVFVENAGNPAPQASYVSCDVVLSWVSPWFSQTHDVYFGSSFEDVNRADRDYPSGVLVSQGQTATTYDPEGLLEYSRTYYWRVDEVNAPPDSTIDKGQIWSFTVEPYCYPITTPIIATASSFSNALSKPDKTVDGSGLNANDEHGTSVSMMWISKKGESPAWIQYEFDKVYKLHQMWVWNGNQTSEPTAGIGAKDVTVEYSTDGTTWTVLDGVPQFAQATGEPNYVHNTTVDFQSVEAKYVKLTITSNWGGKEVRYSLSEVRFLYVPVRPY